jgi:hypothetical protein
MSHRLGQPSLGAADAPLSPVLVPPQGGTRSSPRKRAQPASADSTEVEELKKRSKLEYEADERVKARAVELLRKHLEPLGNVLLNVPATGSCFYVVMAAHLRLRGKQTLGATAASLRKQAEAYLKVSPPFVTVVVTDRVRKEEPERISSAARRRGQLRRLARDPVPSIEA